MRASLDPFDLTARWSTAWTGDDIVVLRNEVEVEHVHAPDIRRVIFVHTIGHGGDATGELSFALVECEDYLVLPAETGFATRVNFEREAFWSRKACIYWGDELTAHLPAHCLARRGLSLARHPCVRRVSRAELAPLVEHWLLDGPQTYEQRRWLAIERAQPFARIDTRFAPGAPAGNRHAA